MTGAPANAQRPRPRGALRPGSRRRGVGEDEAEGRGLGQEARSDRLLERQGRRQGRAQEPQGVQARHEPAQGRHRQGRPQGRRRGRVRQRPARQADTDDDGIKDGAEHAGVVTAFDGETITIREFATGKKVTATLDTECTPATRRRRRRHRRRRLRRRRRDDVRSTLRGRRSPTPPPRTARTRSTSATRTTDACERRSDADVETATGVVLTGAELRDRRRRRVYPSTDTSLARLADRDHPLDRQPRALGDRLGHLHDAGARRAACRAASAA